MGGCGGVGCEGWGVGCGVWGVRGVVGCEGWGVGCCGVWGVGWTKKCNVRVY